MLLPARRLGMTFKLRFGGARGAYHVTCGYYPDGRLGEVFISTNKIGSAAEAIARDGAILLSLALQHGCSLETMAHAITREERGGGRVGEARTGGARPWIISPTYPRKPPSLTCARYSPA
jgi:hypothetical protein